MASTEHLAQIALACLRTCPACPHCYNAPMRNTWRKRVHMRLCVCLPAFNGHGARNRIKRTTVVASNCLLSHVRMDACSCAWRVGWLGCGGVGGGEGIGVGVAVCSVSWLWSRSRSLPLSIMAMAMVLVAMLVLPWSVPKLGVSNDVLVRVGACVWVLVRVLVLVSVLRGGCAKQCAKMARPLRKATCCAHAGART
eukprot:3631451-Alexandrium_andersonii.AAC.1